MSRARRQRLTDRWRGFTPDTAPVWVLDVALAGGLLLLALPRQWATDLYGSEQRWDPSAVGLLLTVLQTLPLAARRAAPVAVLLVTVGSTTIYTLLGLRPSPDYLGVLIAVYTVACLTQPRVSRWYCGATTALMAVVLLPMEGDAAWQAALRTVVMLVVVWMLGLERRRSIDDRAAAVADRERQAAREEVLRREGALVAERARIARSVHDVLGSAVTTTLVHGEVMRTLVAPQSAAGRRLDVMMTACRQALRTVHGAVEALDQGQPAPEPQGWAGILATFQDSGLRVEAGPGLLDLPERGALGTCLRRAVHEGLANALRHAGAGARVEVDVERDDASVRVEVRDDGGVGRPSDPRRSPAAHGALNGGGFGLDSVRRDVVSLGGTIRHGASCPGWLLSVTLPVHPTAMDVTPVVAGRPGR